MKRKLLLFHVKLRLLVLRAKCVAAFVALFYFFTRYDLSRSKTKNHRCKNKGCWHKARTGSCYCGHCSRKWHRNKDTFDKMFKIEE